MTTKTKHTTNPNTILSTNLSDKPTTITIIIKDWSRSNLKKIRFDLSQPFSLLGA
jgi:hypothetical protein